MSQTDLTKINLYEKTVSSMTTTSVQPDDEYSIKDMPIGGITNAQMLQALDSTKKGLFKVGAVYQCTDEGTYTKGQFYKFTGLEWEESSAYTEQMPVDSEMSATSENPVQNKVVKQYVDDATSKEEIIKKLPAFKSIMRVYVSSTSTAYTFPIVSSTNFAVDWGDGTFEFFDTTTTSLTHTFVTTGNIDVIFYGEWKGIQYTSTHIDSKTSISRIFYDANITSVPQYAFYNCTGLTIFKSVYDYIGIGNYAFNGCSSLAIAPSIFDRSTGIQPINGTKITEVEIEATSSIVYNSIFSHNSSIERAIIIGKGATQVRNAMFSTCTSLKYAEIRGTFNDIGDKVFSGCNNLKTIKLNCSQITGLSYGAFENTSSDLVILVPYNLLNSYKTTTNFPHYANHIYPIGGQYSETVTIASSAWTLNSTTNLYEATATVVGATNESRNILDWSLVDSNGNQIEDTYGLGASAQASRSITFTAQTAPTESINIFVQSTLTNYQE